MQSCLVVKLFAKPATVTSRLFNPTINSCTALTRIEMNERSSTPLTLPLCVVCRKIGVNRGGILSDKTVTHRARCVVVVDERDGPKSSDGACAREGQVGDGMFTPS